MYLIPDTDGNKARTPYLLIYFTILFLLSYFIMVIFRRVSKFEFLVTLVTYFVSILLATGHTYVCYLLNYLYGLNASTEIEANFYTKNRRKYTFFSCYDTPNKMARTIERRFQSHYFSHVTTTKIQ